MNKPVTELPTARIELQLPKVPDYEWTDDDKKVVKEATEAIAAYEDRMILETLHTPHLTMGSPADDFTGIRKATPEGLEEIDKKLRNNEFVMLAGTNPYHENTPPFKEVKTIAKDKPKRDGSGKGTRANKGRGGCDEPRKKGKPRR